MKRIILILCILFSYILNAQDSINVSKKPEPSEPKEFEFPKYTEKQLSNGLKVFIIEDHDQPTIGFRFLIPGGSSVDGDKPGLASLTAGLLTKGAGTLSAYTISNILDSLGASINAKDYDDMIFISASGLKKYMNEIMNLLSDIIIKPSFSEEELKKLVKKEIAAIQFRKSHPGALVSILADKVIFGENHPYASNSTEKSLKSIELSDIKKYYSTYFLPNNSSVAIMGDISPDEIIPKLEEALKLWEKGKVTEIKIPDPKPMPIGVYFINRPGSVQSTVAYTAKALPYSDPNYEKITMTSGLIGGGFGSRLVRTLREKYSYTYSPYSNVSNNRYSNKFTCGADVRNTVTDSAITVILDQINSLTKEPPGDDELYRIKRHEVGKYMMNFERTGFVANLIQDANFHGILLDRFETFPKRAMTFNRYDIQRTVSEFLNTRKGSIIVVGSPEIEKELEKFGKVYSYNLDLEPLSGEKSALEEVSLTPDELIKKYNKAIGGVEATNSIKSILSNGKVEMNRGGENFNGKITVMKKAPTKLHQLIEMDLFKQEEWVNVDSAWAFVGNTIIVKKEKDLEKAKLDAQFFPVLNLIKFGFKCQVLGQQNNEILMKVQSQSGNESTYYFNKENYLLNRIESIIETRNGPMPQTISYGEYTKFGDVMLPKFIMTKSPMIESKIEMSYQLNIDINDSEFVPKRD